MSNGRSRLLIIVLVCSLAINLLLVGGIIGRLAFRPPRPPMMDHLGWVIRNLDPATRQALRPGLIAHAKKVRPLRREIRAAQREFVNALLQPELDTQKLDAALGKLRSASDAYQQSMHDEMVVILKKMSYDERKRFVNFLRHRPDMHRRHRDGRNAGSPPEGVSPPQGEGKPAPNEPPPPP